MFLPSCRLSYSRTPLALTVFLLLFPVSARLPETQHFGAVTLQVMSQFTFSHQALFLAILKIKQVKYEERRRNTKQHTETLI